MVIYFALYQYQRNHTNVIFDGNMPNDPLNDVLASATGCVLARVSYWMVATLSEEVHRIWLLT